MTHPANEVLIAYIEGRLPSAEQRSVEEHLSGGCSRCDRRLSILRSILESAAGGPTQAPPDDVLRRALEIARARPRPSPTAAWPRVVAALSFDSYRQPSAAATRGAAHARQMLFTADQIDIDLQIRSSGGDHELLGQVLGPEEASHPASAFVSLQEAGGRVLRASETDARGRFAFDQIPSGSYDLVLDLGHHEVAVAGLEL